MKSWFVVRIKTGAEDKASWHLKKQCFEVYLPRYRKEIRHARKVQVVLRPVFSGYLFIRIDLEHQRWQCINGTMGVIGLVKFGDRPSPVSDAVVDVLRAREENGVVDITPIGLKKGDVVRLREGPFAGHNALLEETSDDKRVILLLSLMCREVRITSAVDNIAKAL